MMGQAVSLLDDLRTLDPYHFEQLIADIWQECQGWSTEVTQASRDWGADIVGRPPGRNQLTIVQAKRYGESTSVTSEDIQQYSALRQHDDRVTGVTVVTTGFFTQPARDLAEHLDVRCINGDDLVELIDRYDAHDIVEWYLNGKPTGGN